jgi:nitroreductase
MNDTTTPDIRAEILKPLRERRSDRHFTQRPLETHVVASLVEAVRWAPSSNNRQPWRLILAQGPEASAKFVDALSDSNKRWAHAAPLKIVMLGSPEEQPDRDGQNRWLLDCGLALENLLVQGYAMGLTAHAMQGWNEQKVLANFNVPAPFRVAALIAVGYRGRIEDLPEDVAEKDRRPRTRKAPGEIAFVDTFGKSYGG